MRSCTKNMIETVKETWEVAGGKISNRLRI